MHLQTGEGCGIPFPGLNRAELKYVGYIHLRANHVKEGDDYNNWRFRVSKTSQNNNMKNILMIGIFESSEYISSQFHGLCIQLNWPSETITQNKYITCRETQRATYDGSGTAYEKLSSRRTHWCGDPLFIFIFWQFF